MESDLCCSSGSPPEPQSPHFSREGNGVHLRAVSIRDLTRMIGSMAELELEKVFAVFPCLPYNTLASLTWKQFIYFP